LYESITAYGRYWLFEENGTLIETNDLRQVSRTANGPCRYAPVGGACTLDARELGNIPGRGMIEVMTAYGRYWEFDGAGRVLPGSDVLLSNVPRFR
jgi:hypothetical protein